MPELPEVENVSLGLRKSGVIGRVIERVELRRRNLRTPLRARLRQELPGQSIKSIDRRAKYLLFTTEDYLLINHLGMTGSWRLGDDTPARKHDHVVVHFASGMRLIFNDPRRFGLLELEDRAEGESSAWLKRLGIEPLGPEFDGEWLFGVSRGMKASVKSLIMDQRRVVGVGNIYASEALHGAGIRPARAAGRLKRSECARLAAAIQSILRDAIAAGGSTIKDYRDSNGEAGRYQDRFAVYGRAGAPCPRCAAPLRSGVLGGRSTFWCAACQS